MNNKVIGGVVGMIVTLFVILFGLQFIITPAESIINNANIADFPMLASAVAMGVVIIALAAMGLSIWGVWQGMKEHRTDHEHGGGSR